MGWCISGFNLVTFPGTTLDECKEHCNANANCHSFDYRSLADADGGTTCALAEVISTTPEVGDDYKTCSTWDYYEKSCASNTKNETMTLDTEEIIVGVDISVDKTSNYIAAIRFHSVHAAASPWSLGAV